MWAMPFKWDAEGGVFRPAGNALLARARRLFHHGEVYPLEVVERVSAKSRGHYHASVHDAWMNLPEDKQAEYPSPDHLRKRALIKCGFYNERSYVCDTAAQATQLCAVVRDSDEFAVVLLKDNVARVFTPRSQAQMSAEEWKDAKTKVLALLADMIGVTRTELQKNGGQSA